MPQKKNADSLELIRGKAGRIYGHVSHLGSVAVLVGFKLAQAFNIIESQSILLLSKSVA